MGKASAIASRPTDKDISKLAWFARWHALAQERKTAVSHHIEEGLPSDESIHISPADLTDEEHSLQQELTAAHAAICRDKARPDLEACARAAAAQQQELDELLESATSALTSLADEAQHLEEAHKLVDRRLARCQDQCVADAVLRLEARDKAAAAARQQRLHMEHMQKIKQELALYKEQLQQHEAEAAAEAAEREKDLVIQEAESSKQRQRRIAFREARRQEHLHELQARRRRAQEAALQLEQRLADLANEVALQHQVEADFERLCGPTQAMLKPAMEQPQVFAPMHGFSTKQIVKDQRFRAMEAVRQHGLQMTPYVCQTLLSAKPASHPRPDNLSSAGGLQL